VSKRVVTVMLVLIVAALVGTVAGCGGGQPKDPLAAALATAKEVRDKLVDGGDWTALASQYSDDTYTKDSGGDLGPVARGDMVQEFEDAVFSLAVGEISQPIKTEYGYHVIEVTGITEARQQTLDEVKDSITATLLEQAKLLPHSRVRHRPLSRPLPQRPPELTPTPPRRRPPFRRTPWPRSAKASSPRRTSMRGSQNSPPSMD
jgi:hypothetical protein